MNSKRPNVSICISVHNTETLLPRCLDSITSQTLQDIEIILVNNGSTDSSLSIMEDYQERYPEIIKVFSQKDMGLAQGRQSGINNATGEFIAFLDADDYVTKDAYEKMYSSAIEYNVDIVECKTVREDKVIGSKYNGVHETSQILKDYFFNGDIPSMMWMRLYSNSLFGKPVFPNLYVNNEDIFALPCLLFRAKNIYFLNEQLHFYTTDNEVSVMNGIKKNTVDEDKIIKNRLKTLHVKEHLEKQFGKDFLENELSLEFKTYTARVILDFCLNEFKTLSPKDCLKVALENTGAKIADIKPCYKYIKYNNKLIQKSVNWFGLARTVQLYRFLKNLLPP
jgi:glycosyltransferase involved in cell wall biosynthesis